MKQKRKSFFEKAHYNPYHIDFKNRKKVTQAKFTDSDYKWETLEKPVTEPDSILMRDIEREEMQKFKNTGVEKRKERVGLGDKIEVEYYHSISSNKIYKYQGVVIGYRNENNLFHSFRFLALIAGNYVILDYPYYSPMLISCKVLSKGIFSKKRKIFHSTKINNFGIRLDEIMKGGRKVNINKKAHKELKKIDVLKDSIVVE